MDRLKTFLLLCAGGSLGAAARYVAGAWFTARFGDRFPWGTFAVNVAGCLALGFVLTILEERLPGSAAWRSLVAVGFLGAFTTFSTFAWETQVLLRDGAWVRAGAYVLGSVALGLLALRAGVLMGRM